jgi:hypothetical protein
MPSESTIPSSTNSGASVELQAGKLSFRSRTDVPFMATFGAMVIGILLAVAAVGAARSRR